MAGVTLNDIINGVNAFTGDASVGGASEATRKLFCINTAKDYFLSQLGLPASEVVQQISYIDNQNLYQLNFGMLEPISLRYNQLAGSNGNNVRQNAKRNFEYMRADEIYTLQQYQANDMVYWAIDYADNANDIVIVTNNIVPSQQINSFDTLNGIFALGDANTIALDTNVYEEGNASLSFTITPSTGKAYIQYQLSSAQDFTPYLNTGIFDLDWFVQTVTGLTGISLQFGSDSVSSVNPSPNFTNYWKISPTATYTSGQWNTPTFNWANATLTGSPNITAITYFQIEIDLNHSTMPTETLWRFDDLELYNPDQMLFTCYTDQVVQDGTTGVSKNDFVNNNDIALFAQIDNSIIRGIAAYAAVLYKPTSLQMDSKFVQGIADSIISNLQYRFPKKTLPLMERLKVVTRR